MRRGEWMIYRDHPLLFLVELEQRKFDHPEKFQLARFAQLELAAELEAQIAQDRTHARGRPGDHQQRVTRREPGGLRHARPLGAGEMARYRPLPSVARDLGVGEAEPIARAHTLGQLVELAAA